MVEKASVLSWRGSDQYYNPYIGRGEVLFTGPDGIRDHQASVLDPNTYVGIGTMSPEGTSDLNYLWRPSRGCPHPLPKSTKVGEVGWGLQFYTDHRQLRSGHQIKFSSSFPGPSRLSNWQAENALSAFYFESGDGRGNKVVKVLCFDLIKRQRGEFRQATEDRHTHLYQNPWYAGPNDKETEDATEDDQIQPCSRSERHMTPPDRSRSLYYRSRTPTPQRTPLYDVPRQTTPRPHSAVPGSKPRSGTHSSSASLHSQHTDRDL